MTPAELLAARRQREAWIDAAANDVQYSFGAVTAASIIRRHAQPFLDAHERLLLDREKIAAICRKYCDSGNNPGAHDLALKILNRMGERPIKETSDG